MNGDVERSFIISGGALVSPGALGGRTLSCHGALAVKKELLIACPDHPERVATGASLIAAVRGITSPNRLSFSSTS